MEPTPLSDAQQEFVNKFLRGETSQARLWRDGMQEIYEVVTALASAEQYWRLEYIRAIFKYEEIKKARLEAGQNLVG